MRIVAIDPGQHVGIAFRNPDGSYDTAMIYTNMPEAWDLIWAAKPGIFIIERFVTGGRISRAGLDTVECQGSFYSLAHVLGAKLYWQRSINRTPYISKAKEILRADASKLASHEVDALAHLLLWEAMHKKEIESWPVA